MALIKTWTVDVRVQKRESEKQVEKVHYSKEKEHSMRPALTGGLYKQVFFYIFSFSLGAFLIQSAPARAWQKIHFFWGQNSRGFLNNLKVSPKLMAFFFSFPLQRSQASIKGLMKYVLYIFIERTIQHMGRNPTRQEKKKKRKNPIRMDRRRYSGNRREPMK